MATNNDKILKVLKTKKELITTTELSNETSIDIKNITRYLKPLENKGLIVRKTIQNGKIRVVMIGLSKEKPHPPIAPRPMPKLHPPKEVIKPPIKEETIDFDLDERLLKWINDLDTRRSFVKLFRDVMPEFKQVNTRVSKEEMTKQFNDTVKTRILNTPLLNEMRNENTLFMKQKSKHNI